MLIIGITGGTGSGKTTLVNQIVSDLSDKNITIISQDSYYKDNTNLDYEGRCLINYDHPDSIDFDLLITHLSELKKGKNIEQPIYSYKQHNRTNQTKITTPKKVIIIEGILILNHKTLRGLIDIKIFIDTDADERLIRRIKRDITERGRDLTEVLNRYQNTLKPMFQKYIAPSQAHADIILPNNKHNSTGINIVKTIINEQFI